MSRDLIAPDHAVMMSTNRDYRLSSLNGFVVNFKANQPTRVPPNCYIEAIGIGAIECEDQPEPEPVVDLTTAAKVSIAESAKLAAEARKGYVRQACLKLIARADPTDFKADGYPKLNKVVSEMAPEAPRPNAGEIADIFDELREDATLLED